MRHVRHSVAELTKECKTWVWDLVAPTSISEMSDEECSDLMLVSRRVGGIIGLDVIGDKQASITYCIQDGENAGQTIPHVHVHVIPRLGNDFSAGNDEVYRQLEADRKPRELVEMVKEAQHYKTLFA
ncbi:hypothetical protein ACOME3_002797 [Neoechinorhynchus agilis]